MADIQVFLKYEFGGIKLGAGAACQVHEATSRSDKCEAVAIKSVVKEDAEAIGKESRKEVAILRKMHHDSICKFYELFEDPLIYYLVFELCEGGTLFDRLEHDIVLEEPDAVQMCKDMFSATCYVHDRGIVHRDLRPESWLLTDFSQEARVKLSNFGLAEFCSQSNLLSQPCGTLHYVAPEVLRGQYGRPSDAWTLGVVLFLMVYGSYPFDGDSCSEVMRNVISSEPDWSDSCYALSNGCRDMLRCLLVKDPGKRLTPSQCLSHPWLKSERAAQANRLARQSTCSRISALAGKCSSLPSRAPELKSAPGGGKRVSCLVTDDIIRLMADDAANALSAYNSKFLQ